MGNYTYRLRTCAIAAYSLVILAGCKEQVKLPAPVPVATATPTPTPTLTPSPTATPATTASPSPSPSPAQIKLVSVVDKQQAILDFAQQYVGEQETQGKNRSKNIDEWNRFAGTSMGDPYCASFVSYILHLAGVKNAPRSAWSPSMTARNRVAFKDIRPADVFGLYYKSKGRVGHTGFIRNPKFSSTMIQTTEANTAPSAASGSARDRDGDGVWNKLRNRKLMSDSKNKYSRY